MALEDVRHTPATQRLSARIHKHLRRRHLAAYGEPLRRVAGFALVNTTYLLHSFARFAHARNEAHIQVTGKGRYQVRLPLPQEVGDAVLGTWRLVHACRRPIASS